MTAYGHKFKSLADLWLLICAMIEEACVELQNSLLLHSATCPLFFELLLYGGASS